MDRAVQFCLTERKFHWFAWNSFSVTSKGWVTEFGLICPSVNITFGVKRVNNKDLICYTLEIGLAIYGQYTIDFLKSPLENVFSVKSFDSSSSPYCCQSVPVYVNCKGSTQNRILVKIGQTWPRKDISHSVSSD